MTYDPVRKVIVLFGGQSVAPGVPPAVLNDTWTWDGNNWQEQHPANRPSPRVFSTMVFDARQGAALLFGGDGGQGQVYAGGFADTWSWDGANWTEVRPKASPPPRSEAAMTYDDQKGELVLFGGVSGQGATFLNDTWIWDGTNWSLRSPSASPPPRIGATIAYDPAVGRVVLFGGIANNANAGGFLKDMWAWDGIAWAPVS